MWIKICGNTNLEDARLATAAGADALGFVFAPSPRRVTEAQVRRIASGLPPQVETYGVFVDASFEQIVRTVEACGLTGVQFHRTQDGGFERRLHEHFAGLGREVKILPVIGWGARQGSAGESPGGAAPPQAAREEEKEAEKNRRRRFDQALLELSRSPSVEAVLVDSFSPGKAGGTGASFDWREAQSSFLRAAPRLRVIVAGGLRPENVEEAIFTLRPWGVDVVSGVEASPGKKDGARVAAFIRAARQAAAGLRDRPAGGPVDCQPSGQSSPSNGQPTPVRLYPADSPGRKRSQ